MDLTYEDLIWAAARWLAYGIGALILLGTTVIIGIAIAVTIKERTKTRRQ
ncbi:hypothetical protein [Streptomyces sp. NPDC002209]